MDDILFSVKIVNPINISLGFVVVHYPVR